MIKKIINNIERLINEGHVQKGDVIELSGLSRNSMTLITACFAGNDSYEVKKTVSIDSKKDNQESYTLHLKYRKDKNA